MQGESVKVTLETGVLLPSPDQQILASTEIGLTHPTQELLSRSALWASRCSVAVANKFALRARLKVETLFIRDTSCDRRIQRLQAQARCMPSAVALGLGNLFASYRPPGLDLLTTMVAFRIGAYDVNLLMAHLSVTFGRFRVVLIGKLIANSKAALDHKHSLCGNPCGTRAIC